MARSLTRVRRRRAPAAGVWGRGVCSCLASPLGPRSMWSFAGGVRVGCIAASLSASTNACMSSLPSSHALHRHARRRLPGRRRCRRCAVSRIKARSDLYEMDLVLDINVDVFPGGWWWWAWAWGDSAAWGECIARGLGRWEVTGKVGGGGVGRGRDVHMQGAAMQEARGELPCERPA